MAPIISRKRSLADMQLTDGSLPIEYNDADYANEVLRLTDGQTELLFDETLAQEAEKLGIIVSRPPTPKNPNVHNSVCESAITVDSAHVRTASTGSQDSNSTGITSRSSNEESDNSMPLIARRKTSSRSNKSLSFSEYEKYLELAEAEESGKTVFVPPPVPAERTPSLFSVSTRRSYDIIKNRFKNRFRLRRNKSCTDGVK